MANKDQYPRVLLVQLTKVKVGDPVNLLIRTQFGDWPKDHLAQIHSGESPGQGEFCGSYYQLRACDRFLGGLFRQLRGGVMEMVALDAVKIQGHSRPVGPLGRCLRILKHRVGNLLMGSGLWEVIFCVRLSRPMAEFIKEFEPDVIYCQGYTLGFATLPLLIARNFSLPICFQTTDDWPRNIYCQSPVGWLLRRQARKLIAYASVRLAFGEKMRYAYQRRYGVPFEATYHLDDPRRFPAGATTKNDPHVTILYVGGLGHRRYEAIADLNAAVTSLAGRMGQIQIKVLCGGIPKEMPSALLDATDIEFGPLPAHEALPGVLAGATVLFLPESFTENPAAIEYSLSTKAHLYMASGRPLLVYGPECSGTVAYAASEGLGVIVNQRDPALLAIGLEKTIGDAASLNACRERAVACFKRNHDLQAGRARILNLLSTAAVHSANFACSRWSAPPRTVQVK